MGDHRLKAFYFPLSFLIHIKGIGLALMIFCIKGKSFIISVLVTIFLSSALQWTTLVQGYYIPLVGLVLKHV